VNVRDALLKLEIDDATGVDDITEQLRTLQRTNEKYADIYRELEEMESCTNLSKLASVIKSIEAQRRLDSEGDFGKLADKFLELYVRTKLAPMRHRYHDHNDEIFKPFEQVFAKLYGITRKSHNDWEFDLVEPLKKLKLAESNLNVRKLLKAAILGRWPLIDRVMQPRLRPFEQFMNKHCARLQQKQDVVEFDNIDSAMYAENPYKAADSARHTYYNGFCLEWLKPEGREKIIDNLKRRLEDKRA
jgi:hypothetical protein